MKKEKKRRVHENTVVCTVDKDVKGGNEGLMYGHLTSVVFSSPWTHRVLAVDHVHDTLERRVDERIKMSSDCV